MSLEEWWEESWKVSGGKMWMAGEVALDPESKREVEG